ncbi:MAG: AMP-binding protein, partial [bacterium]|nr:AMP-binding protein [bacterium]
MNDDKVACENRMNELTKENVSNIYSLTPMQEGMLFHALANERSDAYLQQYSYHLIGTLDVNVFREAWVRLLQRHDVLRTVFKHEFAQKPLQVVLKRRDMELAFHDLRSLPPDEARTRIASYKKDDLERGFELSRDLLFRLTLFQLADREFVVVCTHHHIIMDGWSFGVLQSEFLEIYQALCEQRQPALPSPPPFNRFVKHLESLDRDASRQYWLEVLAGFERQSKFPSGMDSKSSTSRIENLAFEIPAEYAASLSEIVTRESVSLSAILSSCWAILLSRYNNSDDVVFGSVTSGRSLPLPGIERMIGIFINTLPVRVRFENNSLFVDLARSIQSNTIDSLPHSHYPLARIQAESFIKQDLFETIVSMENFPLDERLQTTHEEHSNSFKVKDVDIFDRTHYDFVIQFLPGERLRVNFQYNAARYDRDLIHRLRSNFLTIIQTISNNAHTPLSEISLVSSSDLAWISSLDRGVELSYPDSVGAWFDRVAEERGGAVAVECGEDRLTYAALNARANRVASALRARGVKPET